MKIKVAVMGSSKFDCDDELQKELFSKTEKLAKAIVDNDCALITGETTGLPELLVKSVKKYGGISIGISAAHNATEQKKLYREPLQHSDFIIYTGFGLKGRNLINIRSADIVIIFSGSIGTLNEFTIAYDEDKVIGVLTKSFGIADHIKEIIEFAGNKTTQAKIFYDDNPEILLSQCLKAMKNI